MSTGTGVDVGGDSGTGQEMSNNTFNWSSLISPFTNILGQAANVFSTIWNNWQAKKRQREAQDWNAAQAVLSWQRGLEQWQRENEYNTPSAQMERLREAGINPALAYASGVFNQAGAVTAAPMSGAAKAAPVQAWQVDPLSFAQADLLRAQTEKTEAEAEAISTKLPEEVSMLRQARKESDAKISELNQSVLNLQEQIKNMSEERKLTVQKQITESFNRTMAVQEFNRKSAETVAVIKELASRVTLNQADAELKRSARQLNVQEYEFNILYNAERLLGIKLDNQLKGDQHTINRLNSALLGYEVTDGYADFKARSGFNRGLRSDGAVYKGINSLVGATNYLLSPLKGILGIKF